MQSSVTNVLGIDPGLANTGYGVVARRGMRFVALDGGVVTTRAGVPLEQRLATIFAEVDALIERHQPEAVALEDLFFGANARSAFAVGQARGVVLLAAGRRGIPCASYTPQQPRSRSRGWSARSSACPTTHCPTMPPTRWPSASATPTTRRWRP
jgi:crossover junction endodeoxyribonuclease RuvC